MPSVLIAGSDQTKLYGLRKGLDFPGWAESEKVINSAEGGLLDHQIPAADSYGIPCRGYLKWG
jgi:hypothetical protein